MNRSRNFLLTSLLSTACAGGYEPTDPPSDDAWPMFRANAQRTGVSSGSEVGDAVAELWRVEGINTTDYGAAKGSPAVEEGVLYVGSDDGRFGAYDAEGGDLLWEVEIPDTSQGIHGTPSIGRDAVFIGAYDGILHAFDKEDGTKLWEYERGFQVGASPALVPEHGRVYNTHERSDTGGGFIVAVDAETGKKEWVVRLRAHPHSSVAVSLEHEMLFVGDNLAILHAVDTNRGKRVWKVQLPQTSDDQSDIKTTPTVIDRHEMVVVGAWSEHVHAFDMTSGDLLWETDLGADIMSSTAYSSEHDLVYVGSMSPTKALHALDATTGEEVWRADTGASVMSSPAIDAAEDHVVVGAGRRLFAFDAQTGERAWRHTIGGSVTGSPALWGGRIFVTAKEGDLVALDTE